MDSPANRPTLNPCLREFPRRETRALEERACLGGEHLEALSVLSCGAQEPQRGAVPAGREGTRVAVREDRALVRKERDAGRTHGLARGDVLGVDRACALEARGRSA